MIYVLTPTGGRPECLMLLARYLARQTYQLPLRWILVDDGGGTPPGLCVPPRVEVDWVIPDWCGAKGRSTQAANMTAGLQRVPDDALLLVMEDDDIYLPGHVENIVTALESAELVGERVARYYNVATRRYRVMHAGQHAAMASVGVGGAGLKALRRVCRDHKSALDVHLWRSFIWPKKLLDTANVIGIKGMPGRVGLGVGHRKTFGTPDVTGVLAEWVGPERAALYEQWGAA